jgi:hypothetical protein
MGVTSHEQAVGIAPGHVHKLQALKFVGVLANVEAVGKDNRANFKAALLVLAVRGPVPELGFIAERLRAHEVGHVAQGLGDAAWVLRAKVVVVVSHDGVEMCPFWKDRSNGSKES